MLRRTYSFGFVIVVLIGGIVLAGCRVSKDEGSLGTESTTRVVTATVTSTPTLKPPPTGTSLPTEAAGDQVTVTPAPQTSFPTLTPAAITSVEDGRVLGDTDAPVTLVEFSDYQCPFCARYFLQTWPLIKEQFVDTGRVKYVFKDFPLTSLHPQAPQAHLAAHCAGEQEGDEATAQNPYWAMHDLLYERQETWAGEAELNEVFEQFARDLGLDVEAFSLCLESDRWREAIAADLNEGAGLGVTGTPSFFIDGYPIFGAREFELFAYAIELAEQGELGGAYRPQEE